MRTIFVRRSRNQRWQGQGGWEVAPLLVLGACPPGLLGPRAQVVTDSSRPYERRDFRRWATLRGTILPSGRRLVCYSLPKTTRLLRLLSSNRLRFGDLSLRTGSAFTLHFHVQFGMHKPTISRIQPLEHLLRLLAQGTVT
jgi:hypothetical protein